MRRNLVLAERRRARQSLRAAEILTRERCYADTVARTYYAVLHAAKAALEVHDVAVDSHAAVRRLFGLHMIRTAEIEPEWAKHLGQSLDERLAADYNPEVSFSEEDARDECRQTRRFIRRIRQYLLSKEFTESALRKRST